MRKNILGAAILAAVLASGAFSVCFGNLRETTAAVTETQTADSRAEDTTAAETGTTQASAELKEIMVGVSPTPHAEILNATKEVLASRDYEPKIVGYTDYVQPNNALDSSDLDANYFQHKPYLGSFNKRNGADLVSASAIHYESFGIYADETASLEELPGKATILVPNDVGNEAGALLLLEAQGLIKLKDDAGLGVTKNDIVGNTENLNIIELEVARLPHPVSDGNIAVINGSYTIGAGLRINDALATKDSRSLATAIHSNVVAVREGEESGDATKTLVKTLTSPEVKQFMEETYEGAVVPLF